MSCETVAAALVIDMQLFARVLVLFAMLTSAACFTRQKPPAAVEVKAAPETTTSYLLHVDDRFKPADRAIVVDAFAEWERDTRGVVKFQVSKRKWNSKKNEIPDPIVKCTYEVYVVQRASTDAPVVELEKKKSKEHGRPFIVLGYAQSDCQKREVTLVMDRLANPVLLRNVAVHEAGHLIGLDHIPVPKESVMFPSMNKASKCPTILDMKQFCMLHSCDWREMVSCPVSTR